VKGEQTAELIDEFAVVGTHDDYPQDSLDLRPELTHSIAVAIQRGNERMHPEMLKCFG